MGTLPHPNTNDHLCPACQSANRAATWDKDKRKGRRQVRWCADCGLGWQHPLPAPKAIDDYYQNVPPYIIHGANEKEEGFRRRIDMLGKLAPKRGKLIDIGSGLGHFLKLARNDGWEVLGVETQQSAAEYCRITFGIKVFTGTIQELDSKQGTYDALTLWDVLEHVYQPLTFLQTCINLLKPGGVLVIAVPNASGWPAKIFKNRWRYVMYTHLSYFTRPYIKNILSRYGLIVQAENHTLKVQSLLQGTLAGLPFEIDTEHLLRAGRQGSIEKGRKEQLRSHASIENAKMIAGVLSKARKLALAFNLAPQPFPSGDLMDLYCRKT